MQMFTALPLCHSPPGALKAPPSKRYSPSLRSAASISLFLVLTAAALLLLREFFLLQSTSLTSVASLALTLDPAPSSLARLSLRGALLSYPSALPATLCGCAVSLGAGDAPPIPLSLNGAPCATLSARAPRLDVDAEAAPSGALLAALLASAASSGGGAVLACSASVLGLPGRAVSFPLGRAAASSSTAATPSAPDSAVQHPLPADLAPSFARFEFAAALPLLNGSALLGALGVPVGALSIEAPGAAFAVLEEGAGGAVAAVAWLPISIALAAGDGSNSISSPILLALGGSPLGALGTVAPRVALDAAARVTGLPASTLAGALAALGVRLPLPSAEAAPSAAPLLTLRGAALPPGGAVADVFAALLAPPPRAPGAACAREASPLPWLRALMSGDESAACAGDALLTVRLGASAEAVEAAVAAAAATAAAGPASSPYAPPLVSIIVSAPGASVDASIPRASIGATLSLGSASFLARGLYTVLAPYVGERPAPVAVETRIPPEWRAATALGGGAWAVEPARATDLWASVACGRGLASLSWAGGGPASGKLVANALVELPNALGCVNAFMREYMVGPFAGSPTGEALMRDAAVSSMPRGTVRLVLPSIGIFSLPLGVAARAWLAGNVGASPALNPTTVLSRAPHNASVFPGAFALTEPVPGEPGLARATGVASHAGEATVAIAAGVEAGCAAGKGGSFPVDCSAWGALWRGAGFLGVDGLLLAGECRVAPVAPGAACVSLAYAPDMFGLFNFGSPGAFASNSAAGLDMGDLIGLLGTAGTPAAGNAPGRLTYWDNWVSYDFAYNGAWALEVGASFQAVAFSAVAYYGNVVMSTTNDGAAGWFGIPGYAFTLPRVPVACASPLPTPGLPATSGSSSSGFNLLSSETCARTALAPLLDLGMDVYSAGAPGPSGGGLSGYAAWAALQPTRFVATVLRGALSLIQQSATVTFPRSSWLDRGTGFALSVLHASLEWAVGLLLGSAPGAALANNAVPAGINVLRGPDVALSSLGVYASATLSGAPLGWVDYRDDAMWSASFPTAASAWGALYQVACVLGPGYARPVPILSTGTLTATQAGGAVAATNFSFDVGAALGWGDYALSRLVPAQWTASPFLLSEAVLFGIQRYAGQQVFAGRPSCPAAPTPSPSVTRSPSPSPSATSSSGPSGASSSTAGGATFTKEIVIGASLGALALGVVAGFAVRLQTGRCGCQCGAVGQDKKANIGMELSPLVRNNPAAQQQQPAAGGGTFQTA